ncbi:Receptor-like serine/threonine-protein kinase SD1-8 [Vitis vinifera]|uniref:non-specific serine/threonine protein kinase n=1 Tax=Vitis vinifera TaxID=29760 RepID=A0A438GVF0_VITVI|nr:Receptor-like serine/threonine-protein kinase SD1-8 [Vitis vinifera]
MEMGVAGVFALWYIFLASISSTTAATDTLGPGQYLRDNQTLVSSSHALNWGFSVLETLEPINCRFVRRIERYFRWGASASQRTELVWSSNSTSPANGAVVLQLLDSGNLVVRDGSDTSDDYVWESFDYPSDTLLPTMKLGWKLKTGLHMYLTSWKNADDPSAGDFSYSLDAPDSPQLVVRKGSDKQYRWGPWDGVRFSGSQEFRANPVFTPKFFSDTEEVYYTFIVTDKSALSRSIVTQFGLIQYLYWNNGTKEWSTTVTLQRDNCDRYGMCGPYGNCYSGDPSCRCMKGFSPKSPQSWDMLDWSGGCARKRELDCNKGDGFVKYKPLKLPDNSHLWGNSSLSSEDCRAKCLRNCSCMAYTIINVHGNGGDCVAWFGDLVDMKDFSEGGEELYIRMARSEIELWCTCVALSLQQSCIASPSMGDLTGLDLTLKHKQLGPDPAHLSHGILKRNDLFCALVAWPEAIADAKRKKLVEMIIAIVISIVSGIFILGCIGWGISRMRRRAKRTAREFDSQRDSKEEDQGEDLELPLFDLEVISGATNRFSFEKKIGQGGFGPVYKVLLHRRELRTGQEIAVKRLSQSSGQGLEEFKNEVILISKLQHRNLVKLLGCCIQREERMLIYEYLPNKSLNYFIFDQTGRKLLTWKKRFDIVLGIARGLLYLHQDSRLRIIHRDLKTSNILLDSEMNPKFQILA